MFLNLSFLFISALYDYDQEVRSRALYYWEEMQAIENKDQNEFWSTELSNDDIDYIELFLQVKNGKEYI